MSEDDTGLDRKINSHNPDMHPDDFRRYGRDVVEWIADYLENPRQHQMAARCGLGELPRVLPNAGPPEGKSMEAILADPHWGAAAAIQCGSAGRRIDGSYPGRLRTTDPAPGEPLESSALSCLFLDLILRSRDSGRTAYRGIGRECDALEELPGGDGAGTSHGA